MLDGRFHSVVLGSPLQVRRALAYVLLNARRHAGRVPAKLQLDPASSARWFRGWREDVAQIPEDPLGGMMSTTPTVGSNVVMARAPAIAVEA